MTAHRKPKAAPPLLRYRLVAKGAILTQASTTVALGWLSPLNLTYRLLESAGAVATGVLVMMTVLLAAAWCELLLSVLSSSLAWPTQKAESLWYMAIGLCYLIQSMAGGDLVQTPGAWVLLSNYVCAGLVCTWYGWTSAVRWLDRG